MITLTELREHSEFDQKQISRDASDEQKKLWMAERYLGWNLKRLEHKSNSWGKRALVHLAAILDIAYGNDEDNGCLKQRQTFYEESS